MSKRQIFVYLAALNKLIVLIACLLLLKLAFREVLVLDVESVELGIVDKSDIFDMVDFTVFVID